MALKHSVINKGSYGVFFSSRTSRASEFSKKNTEVDCDLKVQMVRSFGLGIPGTRNVYIGMSVENNGNKIVNITNSRNSEPKRTHQKSDVCHAKMKFQKNAEFLG